MNKLLTVAATLVLAAAVAPLPAQDSSRLYSVPSLPPQDALDRLRLKTSWTFVVPTEGRRDGLASVQLAPREAGAELLVQTRSGTVMSLDAASGRVRWSTRVGVPYRVSQPLAYNHDSVFVINNIILYALDRDTGRPLWQFELASGAVAPPVADEDQIYLSLSNGRFEAYALPNLAVWEKLVHQGARAPGTTSALEASRVFKGIDLPAIGPLSSAREAYRAVPMGPQPTRRYSYVPDDKVEVAPLVAQDRVLLAGVGGDVVGVTKGAASMTWDLRLRGHVRVSPGQHEETAYVASTDFSVYALSIVSGRLFWRTATGGQPSDRPAVLDEDVYLPVDESRLVRLRRADGEELWRNEDAARFLAANKSFVYGADRDGRLVVIDRARGTTLSIYGGTREYFVPVANELTDRVYLAANNGLIVCLHDRDAEKPLVMKTVKEQRPSLPPPSKAGGKEPPPPPPPPPPKGEGVKPKPPDEAEKPKEKDMGEGAKPKAPPEGGKKP